MRGRVWEWVRSWRWGIYLVSVLTGERGAWRCCSKRWIGEPGGCGSGVLEGEVKAGARFVRPIGDGLEVSAGGAVVGFGVDCCGCCR